MVVAIDYYRKSSAALDFYTNTAGAEPDMRQELINTFDGQLPEIPKAQPALLRKMQKDSNGNKILCPCVDSITKEPTKDRFCPICYGEGFYWTETNLQIYRTLEDSSVDNALRDKLRAQGLINIRIVVFYVRYDAQVTEDDKIVRLQLNLDGTATIPKKRLDIYRINTAWDYRSDNGKLEYWKVYTHREDVKHLNPPSYIKA